MGLLASCGLAGNVKRIDLYGPPGLEEYLQAGVRYSQTHFSYPVKVHKSHEGVIYEDDEYIVSCAPLKHRVTAFGYRITEKDRPGHFDVEKAKAVGIPSGPIYGELKQGKTVKLSDGRELARIKSGGSLSTVRTRFFVTAQWS